MKSLGGTAIWTACSTAIKIAVGLVVVKLFALQFGTQGLGQAANFMTLLTVLGVFAGAGIFNGVTKYVAEYEQDKATLATIFSTSSLIIFGFSALLAIIFCVFAPQISQSLFFRHDYANVVRIVGFCQFGIALSNYGLAILRGYRNAKANAISIMIGTLLGLITFLIGLFGFGYQGALIGLALIPALVVFPAQWFLARQQAGLFSINFAGFSKQQVKKLVRFSAMVLVTAITLPLAYVLLRDLLMRNYSIEQVGLWQGISKISDAYLQFITAAFSVYLLPTFSKLTDKLAIKSELFKAVKWVAVAVCSVSIVIYILRHWIILLLYSDQFLMMDKLFQWQLLGDIFKVLSYIFGYLIVAKAALKWYVVAELLQFSLLIGFGYIFIPHSGALGATQAYFATYVCYFVFCIMGFIHYQQSVYRDKP